MKNFLLVLIVASATFFGSCSKDEDTPNTPNTPAAVTFDSALLIGSWNDDLRNNNENNYIFSGDNVNAMFNNFNISYIRPDGTYYTLNGKWVKDGNNVKLTDNIINSNGQYLVYEYIITELSATKLKWKWTESNGVIKTASFTRK